MNRARSLHSLVAENKPFDLLIIGGGATGLGIAVDAASRGLRTALLEQSDFAKATSSRSTKLIHGGIRYLRSGQFLFVFEALRERGLLRRNAPHLVKELRFVVPHYRFGESTLFGLGLKFYELLAGKLSFGPSASLSLREVQASLPALELAGLKGATLFWDAQFDDARLALALALTAEREGAVVANYAPVEKIESLPNGLKLVTARDLELNALFEIQAKVVINATGPFSDSVKKLGGVQSDSANRVRPSQGAHLVLESAFFPGDAALVVPHTVDGRVVFAIPWDGVLIVGTTDTEVQDALLEPRALHSEISYLLETIGRYLTKQPTVDDIRSTFTGVRPLVRSPINGKRSTSRLSREHSIDVSNSGLVSISGGKWTTYRSMAEEAVDTAIRVGNLQADRCRTKLLKLAGSSESSSVNVSAYGTAAPQLQQLCESNPALGERIHPNYPEILAQVVWGVRHEMARTLDDILARRTRLLFKNVAAALEVAPSVAELMAVELGKNAEWIDAQLLAFTSIAKSFEVPRQ